MNPNLLDGLELGLLAPQLPELLELVSEGIYVTNRERRILYWNGGAADISGFEAGDVLGTRCLDNVLMHVDDAGTSLCHRHCALEQAMLDGKPREGHVYLHHRNGHRVPVLVRTAALRNGTGQVVGGIETFSETASVEALRLRVNQLEADSMLDVLTGLPNRRFVQRELDRSVAVFSRNARPFGLLFADVDHFKLVNDTYGHEAGDRVLKMVGATLEGSSRVSDVLGRWGGEEFVVVVDAASVEALNTAAQRARILVEQSWLMIGDSRVGVTVSIGATLVREGDTSQSLLARADSLMYVSKAQGRNRVSSDASGFPDGR